MNTVVISPHLDDAMLSLGGYLQSHPAQVVTVFAGVPELGEVSDYDRSRGFSSSAAAMVIRCAEDSEACADLGCVAEHFDFLDLQYRRSMEDLRSVADRLVAALEPHPTADVFVPLGLGHEDHRFIADVALGCIWSGQTLHVYEELPYRVLHPEEVVARFAEIDEHYERAELPAPLAAGYRGRKRTTLRHYKSQLDDADDPCFYVPERAWHLAPRP